MTARKHPSQLESSEDMTFQRRTWLVERVGWVVLAAILFSGLLGFFGGGGVVASAQVATEDGSLSMHYDRFSRFQSPAQMRVVALADDNASTLRVWIGREYVEAVTLSSITPQPSRVEAAADRFIFEFALAEPAQSSTIMFNTKPTKRWRVRGRLGIDGGGTLAFSQFIYP